MSASLRTNYTKAQHHARMRHHIGQALVLPLVVFLFGAALGATLTFLSHRDEGGVVRSYRHIEAVFNQPGQTVAQRQLLAENLISASNTGIPLNLGGSTASTQQNEAVLEALRGTAATGTPPSLPKPSSGWQHYLATVLSVLGGAAGGASFFLFISYVGECHERQPREFLADLPWRERWPVYFVLLTAAGLPFYAVSAIRVAQHKHQQRLGASQPAELAPQVAEEEEEEAPFELEPDEQPIMLAEADFVHDPEAARAWYERAQGESTRQHIQDELGQLDKDKSGLEATLRHQGQMLQATQGEHDRVMASIKQLRAIDLGPSSTNPGRAEADFERLLQLPGVEKVWVNERDMLCVFVKARIEYEGVTYYVGDWVLSFGIGTEMHSQETLSGIRDSWDGYPDYSLTDGSFCFGGRATTINGHLRKGQLLEAVHLAINCLQSVNDQDRHKIPNAFHVWRDE